MVRRISLPCKKPVEFRYLVYNIDPYAREKQSKSGKEPVVPPLPECKLRTLNSRLAHASTHTRSLSQTFKHKVEQPTNSRETSSSKKNELETQNTTVRGETFACERGCVITDDWNCKVVPVPSKILPPGEPLPSLGPGTYSNLFVNKIVSPVNSVFKDKERFKETSLFTKCSWNIISQKFLGKRVDRPDREL